jgi:hypothetical protein
LESRLEGSGGTPAGDNIGAGTEEEG